MKPTTFTLHALASLLAAVGFLALPAQAQQAPAAKPVNAPQVVDAIQDVFGVIPGQRRNHTKGTCAVGEFVGTKEAQALSKAGLFSGQTIPVTARFSLAGGNAKAPDAARSPRGMALEFKMPDGRLQHMTMLNVPVFSASVPQTFYDALVAQKPDPATGKPDQAKIDAFRASHPDAAPLGKYLAANNPPQSYANAAFFGIHAFKFTDAQGKTTLVKWRFVPQDGVKTLTDDEMKAAPANFLEDKLIARTGQGPAKWDMIVTIGEAGDPDNNPTLFWPEGRKEFKAGTLSISKAMPQPGAACEPINFDPLVMVEGIGPTEDPILLFRSPAYAVSFGKRLSKQ